MGLEVIEKIAKEIDFENLRRRAFGRYERSPNEWLREFGVKRKTCRKCGRRYPATTDCFARHKASRDGLYPICKLCQREARQTEEHRQYIREYQRRYYAERRKDPQERFWNNIQIHLRRSYAIPYRLTEQALGYSKDELIRHIESLFDGPMTWDNYAAKEGFAWELDHIRPISEFTISSSDDPAFRECWGLQNLRPLWRLNNRRRRGEEPLPWSECWHPPEFEDLPCRPPRQ